MVIVVANSHDVFFFFNSQKASSLIIIITCWIALRLYNSRYHYMIFPGEFIYDLLPGDNLFNVMHCNDNIHNGDLFLRHFQKSFRSMTPLIIFEKEELRTP